MNRNDLVKLITVIGRDNLNIISIKQNPVESKIDEVIAMMLKERDPELLVDMIKVWVKPSIEIVNTKESNVLIVRVTARQEWRIEGHMYDSCTVDLQFRLTLREEV